MRKVYRCEHTVPPVWWFTFADRNALGEEIVVEFRKNENTHGSLKKYSGEKMCVLRQERV